MRNVYPPDPDTRTRISEILDPEALAGLLVAILVVGGLLSVAFAPRSTPAASPGPTSSPPAASATAAAAASPSAVATPSSSPVAPTPEPTLTPTTNVSPPPWAAAARVLIEADVRLVDWRETLRSEAAETPVDGDGLARRLRAASAQIQVALNAIDELDRAGAPQDLVDRLREPHLAARLSALRTLTIPFAITNAYRTGAREVVGALSTLEPMMRELAVASGQPDRVPGLSPAPSPVP